MLLQQRDGLDLKLRISGVIERREAIYHVSVLWPATGQLGLEISTKT